MQYRIKVVPDYEPYEHDAYESEEAKQEIDELINRDGVWGYIVERLVPASEPCVTCGNCKPEHWERVDSCFGFLGNDTEFMMEQARESIPEGVEALTVDEKGREI